MTETWQAIKTVSSIFFIVIGGVWFYLGNLFLEQGDIYIGTLLILLALIIIFPSAYHIINWLRGKNKKEVSE